MGIYGIRLAEGETLRPGDKYASTSGVMGKVPLPWVRIGHGRHIMGEGTMKYMAPHIATLFNEMSDRRTGMLLRTVGPYYTALSTKFGRCGHNHKTKKAALPCLERLKLKLAAGRREAAQAGLKTRSATLAAKKLVRSKWPEAQVFMPTSAHMVVYSSPALDYVLGVGPTKSAAWLAAAEGAA
jgi:hypothetical protein